MTMSGRSIAAVIAVAGSLCVGACSAGSTPSSSSSVKVLLQKASAEARAHQYSRASADLTAVLRREPNNVYALFDRALLAQKEGRVAVALAGYDVLLHQEPTYAPALFNSALIYSETDPSRAMDLYREIIRLRKTAPLSYLNLGLLEEKAGRRVQASADLQIALQQQPALRSRLTKAQQRLVATTKGAPKTSSSP